MFWNVLNKTENSEIHKKVMHFDRFLIFSWNRSKTLRNPICFEMDWTKQTISKIYKNYIFWQISHFLLKLIKNIKKSYMFWNGLNKTENFEKTQKVIYIDGFIIFSWNWSKTVRIPICFEMYWIKQKIPKYTKKLCILTDFSFSLEIDQKH